MTLCKEEMESQIVERTGKEVQLADGMNLIDLYIKTMYFDQFPLYPGSKGSGGRLVKVTKQQLEDDSESGGKELKGAPMVKPWTIVDRIFSEEDVPIKDGVRDWTEEEAELSRTLQSYANKPGPIFKRPNGEFAYLVEDRQNSSDPTKKYLGGKLLDDFGRSTFEDRFVVPLVPTLSKKFKRKERRNSVDKQAKNGQNKTKSVVQNENKADEKMENEKKEMGMGASEAEKDSKRTDSLLSSGDSKDNGPEMTDVSVDYSETQPDVTVMTNNGNDSVADNPANSELISEYNKLYR